MSRDEGITVGIAVVVASLIGAALGVLIRTGFKSEDVFAFAGALVGAGLTVAGAAWVADRSSKTVERAEQELLRSECTKLLAMSHKANDAGIVDNIVVWTDAWREAWHALAKEAFEVRAVLAQGLALSKSLDFRQRVQAIKAEQAIIAFGNYYSDVTSDTYEDSPYDERDWPGTMAYMDECLIAFIAILR